MGEIRIAIVGVGNCASALIQGLHYYAQNGSLGLLHPHLGEYKPSDIRVVAAFDIDARKVGQDLSQAIFAEPNCTLVFYPGVPRYGVEVQMGPVLDGVADHMAEYSECEAFRIAKREPVDVIQTLKEAGAQILVNYLPVGSTEATQHYAKCCLKARVALVNCIPVFIASDSEWARKFEKKGLPVIGDDIKSQLGATITHRTLAKLFEERGIKLERTYQLNVGGNTDFLNLLERSRRTTKKISKTESVQSQLKRPLPEQSIHIGPSDYVPWLKDNKVCFIRMEGRGFGGVPITLELRLSVEDSPNSAGMAIDAIRACKLALDRGIAGPLHSPSAVTMKHPPVQYPDSEARLLFEEFITGRRER
ncbi:inositol-3-phosphate synthase [Candidatus Acetothermia bacterium]|nr:inositol-3-phosphate synthase [Candidatus Acetothermia bacterium]MBI3460462.1 inositol-3-phosphate synthase [Candidatus Acetothermia bacterium]